MFCAPVHRTQSSRCLGKYNIQGRDGVPGWGLDLQSFTQHLDSFWGVAHSPWQNLGSPAWLPFLGSRLLPFDPVLGSSSLFVTHMTWQSMLRTVKGFLFFFSFKIFKTKTSKASWCVISIAISPKAMGKWEMWKRLPRWLGSGRQRVTSDIWIGGGTWVPAARCKYLHVFTRLVEIFLSLQIREQITLLH